MKMNTYVVACNGDPTCIVTAENKKQAIEMTLKEELKAFGDNQCEGWEAYEIEDYFGDDYEPSLFGWIVRDGCVYHKYFLYN